MKIMFICTGNICRSAMAEKMLKKKLEEIGTNKIEVYSSGIYAQNGDIPTYEAKEVMKEIGIDISEHRAINISNSIIKEMDLILCATRGHKIAVLDIYPELEGRVYTMKEYVEYERQYHDSINIKDPWGYDLETYRSCVAEIEECIDLLLAKLKKSGDLIL